MESVEKIAHLMRQAVSQHGFVIHDNPREDGSILWCDHCGQAIGRMPYVQAATALHECPSTTGPTVVRFRL